ncbi:MAG: M15 family metallopeptidase [Clostridia bacterium]|nr:M15 family metallopeptidase [Clostridia bacterium]
MASSKNQRKNKGGRKLEFFIYIVAVLLVCLLVLGVVKGVRKLIGWSFNSETQTDTIVSNIETVPARPTPSIVDSLPTVTPTDSVESKENLAAQQKPVTPENDYITYTKSGKDELDEWYLRLINGNNRLDPNWRTEMTDIGGQQIDSRIVEAYRDMCNAASADGANLWALSGYRSYSTQQELYTNRVARAKNENPSFNQAQAEDYAATHVARPGTSEHQSGLAIDFNSVETDFANTVEGKWLKKNAENYGFILRYEKDKQSKTNVTWEPWHYRFVGVKHAKRMNQLGYCMEEYVDHLKNGGN